MKYTRKERIECEAERVGMTEAQAERLGIIMSPDGVFQASGSNGWKVGRAGDWLVRWPDDRIQIFTDKAFKAMHEEADPGRTMDGCFGPYQTPEELAIEAHNHANKVALGRAIADREGPGIYRMSIRHFLRRFSRAEVEAVIAYMQSPDKNQPPNTTP